MKGRLRIALLLAALASAASGSARPAVVLEEEETVFRLSAPGASRVFLVGDFNGWNPTLDRMEGTKSGFEIRLFLVAGRYRYRFVVDGASIPDPDNPHRDEDGSSLFILREKDGALELLFEEPTARGRAGAGSRASLGGKLSIDAAPNDSRAHLEGTIAGTIEGNIEMDAAVGLTYGAVEPGFRPPFVPVNKDFEPQTAPGSAFLLRVRGAYAFDRGRIVAFSRTGDLGLERPFSLLGTVGPFGYPVLLFSRGIAAEAKLPFDLSAQAVFASRLDCYQSIWDYVYYPPPPQVHLPFRSRIDSDIFTLEAGRSGEASDLRYLFRFDKRCATPWPELDEGFHGEYDGHEEVEFHGAFLRFGDTSRVSVCAEGVFGRRDIVITEQDSPDSRRIAPEWEWERGYRARLGIGYRQSRMSVRADYSRTTIEGESRLRGGRSDGIRDALSLGLAGARWGLDVALDAKMEWYSAQNTGSTFWLATGNFWLDGIELTPTLMPFLSAREIGELRLSVRERGAGEAFVPLDTRFRLSFLGRIDPGSSGRLVTETRASKGIDLLRGISAFADVRYVDYRHDIRSWLHTQCLGGYLALKWNIRESAWCALGWGVPPHRFDRWTYRFEDHGREDYLIEHGGMSGSGVNDEACAVWELLDAEWDLSEEKWITFEAGFEF